ncbi:MAG: ABC transporter ATP-binding protein [Leptolyngbyaceae cyanobacterium MO_188.B28]|nr:ABC transporter ATP-binding protein [Leptolyngbyaceae cyanobacterium MO_188.B28]
MSFRRLLTSFVRRYPARISLNIIMGFSGAIFNGVSTALIVPVVLQLLGQEVTLEQGPPIIKALFYPFEGISAQYRLLAMLGVVLTTILLKNITNYLSSFVSFSLQRSLTNDLREEALKVLLETDLEFYSKSKIGELATRLNGDISRSATAVTTFIRLLIVSITILLFVGILLSISWKLTLISSVLLAFVALVNQHCVKQSKIFGAQVTLMHKAYSVSVLEALGGIRLVKATTNEEKEFQHISKLMRELEQVQLKSQMNIAAVAPISETTGITAIIAISLLGRALFSDTIDALSAVLLTYLFALFRLLPFVSQLNGVRTRLANASASINFANDLLTRSNKPFMANGTLPFNRIREGIHFNRLSFSYPGHKKMVLKEIDLYLPRGKTLALVGTSGAGKSTFADLLPRFYDPTSGCISIDGVDLRQFDYKSLRKAMGIVSQSTYLFNDSVRNNLLYSRPDATDDQLIEAAKRANAYNFIMDLPKGWNTEIGDRGVMLSGGQRQRLAIARALLKDPDILILDEATSALDTVSERFVQEAIEELSRDRTTLLIAHRLSTVQNADQIAVLDQGRVIEIGTHNELLDKNGYYNQLYSMQFANSLSSEKSVQTSQNLTHSKNHEDAFNNVSYQARNSLNSVIGCLTLLADEIGAENSSKDQIELTEEAYQSAINLFKSLEIFENKLK